jgi:23S rRNA (guanosine2251-2'-O)-methyltransferase
LDAARETGFWTVGADLGPEAIPLSAVPRRLLRGDVALVLGAEGKGLRVGIRKRIDHPVSIPMRGHVASLNVSTAAAVLLYAVTQGQAESS